MKKILILSTFTLILTFTCLSTFAATVNVSPASPGYTPMVIPILGIYSSTSFNVGAVKFKAPANYQIVTASVNARSVSGTNPTLKVRLKSGSFTNYSTTLGSAGTPADLTAGTNTKIADESTVAIDLVSGGTSPKWRDLTVFILLKRL